jgi:ParB family chromosome partitioning protein
MTTESKTVKLSELTIDPSNVRKTGRGEEPMFAASIRARGVIEPLIVRQNPKGGYLIVNGGERFTALKFLYEKGEKAAGYDVTKDFPVRVEVADRTDDNARATSLATNLVRAGMHPVDEFEAFAALVKEGALIEVIASEYARTVPQVRQALSLAAIAPEIRKAWREGKIDGEAAEAYAQTRDLAHQVRTFKKLKGRAFDAWAVNQEIAGARAHELDKLLKLVGKKEYEAAGHQVNPSLFGDDDRETITVNNVPALKAMALREVSDECDRLTKDGWGWALPRDEAPKDLYAWRRLPHETPSKAQKALAGCTVDVNYEGKFEVERGYIKPGVSVKIEKTPAQKAARAAAGPAKPGVLSNALAQRLREQQAAATKMAISVTVQARYKDKLFCLFASACNDLIDAARPQATASAVRDILDDARDQIDAAVMKTALLKHFDADDYFANAPRAMAFAAMRDMKIEPLKNAKKAALAKQATDAAKKAGWLPPQFRTKGYAGPKTKAEPKSTRKKRL